MPEVRFAHAINRALADAMQADERVVLLGEDVAAPGGAIGVTRGLRAAIDDPNPVIFVEHKALYSAKGTLADAPAPVAIGKASICRSGKDVTIAAYGAAVAVALAAARALADEGIDAEVIDLRSIQP